MCKKKIVAKLCLLRSTVVYLSKKSGPWCESWQENITAGTLPTWKLIIIKLRHSRYKLIPCCVRLCSKVVSTDARPYSEPCTALMSGCFQNISCYKPIIIIHLLRQSDSIIRFYVLQQTNHLWNWDELNFVCNMSLKLGSNQLNPTHNVVFNAKFK